jgi:uncharacterized membrane protein YjjP (DUF1212 family)
LTGNDGGTLPKLNEALDALLWFGISMMRAGNTAFRTREWMQTLAAKLGFDAISLSFTLDSITASARRRDGSATMVREIGSPGVNASRIRELEQLVKTTESGSAPLTVTAKLAEIDAAPPFFSSIQVAAAVGVASGAFAFLNGSDALEMIAAAISGGIGQWSRALLSRQKLNQYGVAAVCAVIASGTYVLIAAVANRTGFVFAGRPAGFISSVLFLVPGFPLVAALLDLLQHQTLAAVTRMTYGLMIFLAVTFGLSIVVGIVRIDLSPQAVLELAYPLKLLFRAVASFVGGYGFAMLFNNSTRGALAVGVLALTANELRLGLHDAGMMLAPASFFGALAVGLLATLGHQRLDVPRITLSVPAIVIMVPGVYAFEMIVFFNRGQMLEALQAAALCGFVMGALAMGLAAARFFNWK